QAAHLSSAAFVSCASMFVLVEIRTRGKGGAGESGRADARGRRRTRPTSRRLADGDYIGAEAGICGPASAGSGRLAYGAAPGARFTATAFKEFLEALQVAAGAHGRRADHVAHHLDGAARLI